MSETQTKRNYSASDFDQSAAAPKRPRLAVTGIVKGLGTPKETASGDYDMSDINIESTRGGRRIFGRFLFRPEWFTPGFKPTEVYGEESRFLTVWRMHGIPPVDFRKKTNQHVLARNTTVAAICGGTVEGVTLLKEALAAAFAELPADRSELTSEEIVAILNGVNAKIGQREQIFELKQSRDQGGELTDRYELDRFRGALSKESYDSLVKAAIKTADDPDISRRIKIEFRVGS